MEFLIDYGLFLAKAVTIVVAVMFVVGGILASAAQRKEQEEGEISITYLNDRLKLIEEAVKKAVLPGVLYKQAHKQLKKQEKAKKKEEKKHARKDGDEEHRKRVFVVDFDGDMRASEVNHLRQEITAILTTATDKDEVVIRLESPGGMVHGYGLAASQLVRVRNRNIQLTACVDKVAASGGYMMACIANRIVAAPFAVVGSIGVVAQLPNFNRFLKKHDVDIELHTAGEYKRTLTMLGENTEEGRAKFKQELEETHALFKAFVSEHRPQVEISQVATGEHWYGQQAIDKKLVDDLKTSDEYLMDACQDADVYLVKYEHKKSLAEKVGLHAEAALERTLWRWIARLSGNKLNA